VCRISVPGRTCAVDLEFEIEIVVADEDWMDFTLVSSKFDRRKMSVKSDSRMQC